MCTYSMVIDHYRDKWADRLLNAPYVPNITFPQDTFFPAVDPSKFKIIDDTNERLKKQLDEQSETIAELRKDFDEMKKLLIRAKRYDEENGEPHCESDEKIELLRKVAEMIGVELTPDMLP